MRPTVARMFIAAAAISLAACSPQSTGGPSDADEVNVGINNQLGNVISVVLKVGTKSFPAFQVQSGGYVTGEYSPATPGVAVTITVTSLGAAIAPPAMICYPKASIIGTSEYGQVNVGGSITCPDRNTWQ